MHLFINGGVQHDVNRDDIKIDKAKVWLLPFSLGEGEPFED